MTVPSTRRHPDTAQPTSLDEPARVALPGFADRLAEARQRSVDELIARLVGRQQGITAPDAAEETA